MNILVTEDEPAIRLTMAAALRSCGYDVSAAETGVEALASVEARRPDLIVLDLNLPVMDGWEFLRILRLRPAYAQIPVLIVTAEHGVTASKLGAQGCLAKPFDLEDLLEAAEELLRGRGANAHMEASVSQAASRHRP